ncbi:hypothetical protein A1332_08320 [Methylomonas methanica]|uniref:Uncharacterized protein n=1 Tax=Methylomonas methanica TaxID=421 RepID=A0A177MQX7_METMH|nr:hypothetical protein A1332_08320 [Methylomonas methanica]
MFKPTLSATEPTIVAADLQSSSANLNYLQLKLCHWPSAAAGHYLPSENIKNSVLNDCFNIIF